MIKTSPWRLTLNGDIKKAGRSKQLNLLWQSLLFPEVAQSRSNSWELHLARTSGHQQAGEFVAIPVPSCFHGSQLCWLSPCLCPRLPRSNFYILCWLCHSASSLSTSTSDQLMAICLLVAEPHWSLWDSMALSRNNFMTRVLLKVP